MTRTLYRGGALADARSEELDVGVSILVEDGRIAWLGREGEEPDAGDAEIVDAGGSTFVPGMVDAHSHLTLPGGSHWIERGHDPPERMLDVAERNGELLTHAGVRWARDVGSPTRVDPVDGIERPLAIGVRDRWRGRADRPYVRAAGTWILRPGMLPGLVVEANDADELLAAATAQLDAGADLVKLYMDGPERGVAPWALDEVRRVVDAAHARGAKVTAHSGDLPGARVAADARVDSIEHGFELDDDVATMMASNGTMLVSTLTVMKSWLTFGRTTRLERFFGAESEAKIRDRRATAQESVRVAKGAGVRIAAGTDFGGGSSRANQLAWEVESLVEAGLEPWEALASATWRGGELLEEPDAGVIQHEGPADFFLVHGDPLSDPTALWRVWRVAWL
jgi:imidazolonepropionase-like amidohydrolase